MVIVKENPLDTPSEGFSLSSDNQCYKKDKNTCTEKRFVLYFYYALLLHDNLRKASGVFPRSAFALCLLTVWVLRLAVDRKRPFEADGANISPLIPKAKTGRSFPSRHAACAFTVATLFVPFAWAVAAALYLLGMVICYSRFALGWHYPSDLCGGAGLGVLCGLLILFA